MLEAVLVKFSRTLVLHFVLVQRGKEIQLILACNVDYKQISVALVGQRAEIVRSYGIIINTAISMLCAEQSKSYDVNVAHG